jgi:hypothetical protein
MDIKGKVAESRGGFEKLVGKIPGYKGYKEKEMRRDADKLLRQTLARQLDDQRVRLSGLQLELINKRRYGLLDDLERAVGKLTLLSDRIKMATYGYSGLFDAVKVKEKELDALYDFDNSLIDSVPKVAAGIDGVEAAITSDGDVPAAITALVGVLQTLSTTFDHRQEVILQE